MNEFEYINFRIQDLHPDALLYSFRNGYRYDPSDISISKVKIGAERIKLLLPSSEARNLYEIKYTKQKMLNHSWEPLEPEADKHFWELMDIDCGLQWGCDELLVLHSERSEYADKLDYGVHWFANGLLCSEHWYRLYKDINVVTEYRDITTPWVCVNRLIDNKRSYRIEFLNMLDVNKGTYSLLANDPQTERSLREIYPENRIQPCSFDDHENTSAWITVNKPTPINSAFLHVVTETVVDRVHLTEKIFKPIVLKQPFVLVGGAGCLEYLKDYGFSTFSRWWSEDYDNIQDTTERMQAVAEIVNWIGKQDRLESLRNQMKETLDYNYHWFYNGFSSKCWDELILNLKSVI